LSALETWRASLPDEAAERIPNSLKLVIPGAPRTKKNSPVLVRNVSDAFLRNFILDWERENTEVTVSENEVIQWLNNRETVLPHPRLLPSQAYRDWEAAAITGILPVLEPFRMYFPINYACHMMAKIYRDRDVGDWCGYVQGIGDFLEDVGILQDDVLLRSFDGTRLYKDAENPRIELWLTPWTQEGNTGLFELPAKQWANHVEPEPESISADEEQRGGARTSGLFSVYGGRRHG